MAVNNQNIGNDTIYIRTGSPDYFVVFDPHGIKEVIDIRYSGAKYIVKNKEIIEPWYSHPIIGRGIGYDPLSPLKPARSDLEVLLLTIYFKDLFLGSDKVLNDFNSDMESASMLGEYDSINIIDFMVLTGAKERTYRAPNNSMIDIMTLGPDDERPKLSEVNDTEEGNTLMIDIIKYRGLKGFIPHLFAAKAISFDNLVSLVEYFYPDIPARKDYYSLSLGPMLKQKQAPLFNSNQLKKLGLL